MEYAEGRGQALLVFRVLSAVCPAWLTSSGRGMPLPLPPALPASQPDRSPPAVPLFLPPPACRPRPALCAGGQGGGQRRPPVWVAPARAARGVRHRQGAGAGCVGTVPSGLGAEGCMCRGSVAYDVAKARVLRGWVLRCCGFMTEYGSAERHAASPMYGWIDAEGGVQGSMWRRSRLNPAEPGSIIWGALCTAAPLSPPASAHACRAGAQLPARKGRGPQ